MGARPGFHDRNSIQIELVEIDRPQCLVSVCLVGKPEGLWIPRRRDTGVLAEDLPIALLPGKTQRDVEVVEDVEHLLDSRIGVL